MAGSYYAATAHRAPAYPSLTEEIDADLVVVGGGCTGLSAALHAAGWGLKVVLLEGGKVGWGASGRNGGQMIPGLRKGAVELVRAYGSERARALFDLSLEARALVLGLIERHGIACDLKATGHLLAAVKASDLRHMEAEAECLATVMNYSEVELLSAEEVRGEVDTPYAGGLMDRQGGHFHSLNYTLGLAQAASAAGVRIFENSVATKLETGCDARVRTATGAVRAGQVLLAGDALLQGLSPKVNNRIMPVANYLVATAPLLDPRALIPRDAAISDNRFVVNYYRLTADGRLLFGGGERYTPAPPRDIAAFVRPYMEAVFPQLRGTRIEHAWGGLVSITRNRLPQIGRQGEVYFAHGYSGMGAILSTLAGKLVVEAMAGETDRFDLFAGVAPPAFPGGVGLRGPLHVLGMLWYALRDRL
ncbi:MAG: FAD-binding oxidoreductase [Pseudomonadota bacterium]|nr:FAD-binding oxidoreductase [Pseudomonadota bacterium]